MKFRTRLASIYYTYCRKYLKKEDGAILKKIPKFLKKIDENYKCFKHSLAEKYPGIIKPDVSIVCISLTSNCNLRCKGCLYGRSFMPEESLDCITIKNVLDDIKDLNIPVVQFYGGEPLLHRDLNEIIAHAINLGIAPRLVTNGILLSEKKVGELYQAGLRDIDVGMYGNGEDYNNYVSRNDSFSKLEKNLKFIKNTYSDMVVSLGFLLMKPTCNLNSLHKFLNFSYQYTIPTSIHLIHYDFPYFSEGENCELQLYEKDRPIIEDIVKEVIDFKKMHPNLITNSLVGLKSIPDWLIKKGEMKIPCYMYDNIWIGPNGVVRVCQKNIDLGNVHNSRFKHIVYTDLHNTSVQNCFELNCTNCHVGWDKRTSQYPASRKKYGQVF